ncbi:MAG: hypothetical protein GY720_11730 [bacterium]|nr:hypothetical protein [bacterium]
MKRRRNIAGPRGHVSGVARELPRGDDDVEPDSLLPAWVQRTLAVAAVVATLAFATQVALYWTVGDDWGWRCGPDHPWYDARMSEHFGPSCQEPISL